MISVPAFAGIVLVVFLAVSWAIVAWARRQEQEND